MNPTLLRVYHSLPETLQSATAAARGHYLRAWRYGRATPRISEEAIEREHWTAEQWTQCRAARLDYILDRAVRQVPFYREMWAERRRRGDTRSWRVLDNWPILEKQTLRANARAFVADDCCPLLMFHEHTSGTTGTPLSLWRSRRTIRAWYALSEARWRGWYGVSARDRWAILGGQLVTPVGQKRPPFWVWNPALQQLYMSSYHISSDLAGYYLDALESFQIRYVLAYPSALAALAREATRLGYRCPHLRVAIANAEPVFDSQRDLVKRAFGCPLRETYGMAEYVAAAGECQAGRLHLWPEVGVVEVLEGEQSVAPGETGDLVCTSLLDADMPLIRYRVGDRGATATDASCACGRTMPLLDHIEGRSDDMLVTPTGRRIGRIDPVFKAALPIKEAQIVQTTVGRLHVRYVPAAGFTADSARQIIAAIQERMDGVEVTLEAVESIPRSANGKFRAVVSRVSQENFADVSS